MLTSNPVRDRTLAAKYYIDPDVLKKEKELFFKTWQFVGTPNNWPMRATLLRLRF